MSPPKSTPKWVLFVKTLFGGFAALLWIGAVLCFISFAVDSSVPDNLYLGITLVVVVTITGIFSYYQDAKSASIMEGFKSMVPGKAHVRRNGQVLDINSEDLVRGDIVTVGPGDKIPADIRIMECSGLKVCWWWLCLLLVDGGWNYYLSSTAVPSPRLGLTLASVRSTTRR